MSLVVKYESKNEGAELYSLFQAQTHSSRNWRKNLHGIFYVDYRNGVGQKF
jgi:hypothetical protein